MVISKLNTISIIYLVGDFNKYKCVQLFILDKVPNLLLAIQNIYTIDLLQKHIFAREGKG
ncbi:hypothetical protein A4S05_23575 [Nostoc sp. KVJ20]|nr:hypothetical protein A4S05_23575 [Nostoc sp. KVJ20]